MKKNKLLSIHKIIMIIATIGHLALTPVHNDALTLLTNTYCGFIMFMFVLTGLSCLFNATRIGDTKIKSLIVTTVCAAVSIGFGIYLAILYVDGYKFSLENFKPEDSMNVLMALILTITVISSKVVSLVFLGLSKFKK
ncbi:MAG: hypothetical protein R3Y60_04920 [bacterium]